MKISSRLVFISHLFILTYASSAVSPDGLPVGSPPPVSPPRNKTDFGAIFSSIRHRRTHAQRSTEVVSARDASPPSPDFFDLTFGPSNAANNAIGYMGFVSLTDYDVDLCAEHCNQRAFDASSGPCIYFNIWAPVINGTAGSPVCSLYNTVTDASTATNTGQGDLQVTESRGYTRTSLIQDGSFQDYTCVISQNNGCPFMPSAFWTREFTVDYDFVLVNNFPAHSGTSSALFIVNSAPFNNPPPDVPSTLTYTPALGTTAGQTYVLSFFYTINEFAPSPAGSLFSVWWNGVSVLEVTQPAVTSVVQSFSFLNIEVEVIATGSDTLFFKNGAVDPHEVFIDDIALFAKFT